MKLSINTKRILLQGIKIVSALVLLYLLFSWLIFLVMPFIIGFIVALLARPVVDRLVTKLKLPRSVSVIAVLLTAIIIIGGGVIIAISQAVGFLTGLVVNAYNIHTLPTQFYRDIVDRARQLYINLPEETAGIIEQNLRTISLNLVQYFIGTGTRLLSNLRALPEIFIFILVTFMASYFITRDFDAIMRFMSNQLPPSWQIKMKDAKSDMIRAVVGYIKAQAILIITSFIITLAGLLIMGIRYGLLISVIIMIVDILPVVGTGTILIPWSVINFLLGDYSLGIALLALYAVITTVKQVMEPRVVGKGIGLHPLIALFSMYVGLKIFGITGLFIGPAIAVIIRIMQRSGVLPQWKRRA